ncbi:Rossmann-like and DUF2520 domain-containing protein [Saccharicrinis sp. FJH54]|uniref:Rossmann-like and DUF2520 domain-containing protein n=1 Tax=Saccharicrinis sp. FJH54 TaxID=3344665 RepID=UPI0035D461CD
MKREILNIVLLGSGNVATHLGLNLHKMGIRIIQVYSRTETNAKVLAQQLNASFTADLGSIENDADLYIIALKDNCIAEVVSDKRLKNKPMVHTAGSVGTDVFKDSTQQYGVLYPFQTFTKSREVSFKAIPVLIEASNPDFEYALMKLAGRLSDRVIQANSAQRAILHISAVFACNFTNHMYAVAEDLLQSSGLSFDLLKPLISETAEKVMMMRPVEAQTGPAVRFDSVILDQQMKKLKDEPVYQKIYGLLSESIQKQQKRKNG